MVKQITLNFFSKKNLSKFFLFSAKKYNLTAVNIDSSESESSKPTKNKKSNIRSRCSSGSDSECAEFPKPKKKVNYYQNFLLLSFNDYIEYPIFKHF